MTHDPEAIGRARYEADCARWPTYHDGRPRPAWDNLRDWAKETWCRDEETNR